MVNKTFLIMVISFLLTSCSSSTNVVDSEIELQMFVSAFKDYFEKNTTFDTKENRRNQCSIAIGGISEGFDATFSSFEAMNNWVKQFKDPRMAIHSDSITSQLAKLILISLEGCGDLKGEAALFVAAFSNISQKHSKGSQAKALLQAFKKYNDEIGFIASNEILFFDDIDSDGSLDGIISYKSHDGNAINSMLAIFNKIETKWIFSQEVWLPSGDLLSINNGIIKINETIWLPDDAQCCPSLEKIKLYRVNKSSNLPKEVAN